MTDKNIPDELDAAMLLALDTLKNTPPDNPDYATIADQITKLHNMREANKPQRVDPNTLLQIAANLVGIGMVTKYEKTNVIVSKAFGMLLKFK